MLVYDDAAGQWVEDDTSGGDAGDNDTLVQLGGDDADLGGSSGDMGGDDYGTDSPSYFDFGGMGEPSSDSSGNKTYTLDDGSTVTFDANMNPVGATESTDPSVKGNSVAFNKILSWTNSNLGSTAAKVFQKMMDNPGATVGTAMAAAKLLYDSTKDTGGYNKPVPKMDATRQQVDYAVDPNRRPGEAGRQYFTDTQYTPQGNAAALAAAKAASAEQAAGLRAAAPVATPSVNPWAGKMPTAWNPKKVESATGALPTSGSAGLMQAYDEAQKSLRPEAAPIETVEPGVMNMAKGGIADAGRYLQGKTDGMADQLSTTIDGTQPAALSHGEFVIPADVVSHLGNGNSDAGAKKLYEMMGRIRQARTGTKKQGKQINPDEFTMGGLTAAYAAGGRVQGFEVGGTVVSPAVTGSAGVPLDTSKTSTLSPWVGDYVTGALGEAGALAAQPYQAYKGPLTAGESGLQQQAFAGASDIASAGYTPGTFTGGFTADIAKQYMNPYLQASLDPQLKEMRRQSEISRLGDTSRLTKAGAFGGSRQAIMESEGARNLLGEQSKALGQGYKTAYDTAAQQYAKERGEEEASRQFGANFGLQSVKNLADLGAQQRGITSEGIAADKKQFEEQRDWQYQMPQYKLGLLQGLPTGASTSSTNQDALSKIQSDISGLGTLYERLQKLIPTT